MANVLFLVHRIPYPPDKGDKVRSFHVLKHLIERHRVFVGTFVDDPDDWSHVSALQSLCAGVHVADLRPVRARIASLVGLLKREPLTLGYYRDAGLGAWVRQTLKQQSIDAVVVFSSSMAQYADAVRDVPVLVDLVDVDSAKWSEYADRHPWPMSWLYRREGQLLLRYERQVVARSTRSFFVTEKETDLFRRLAPECAQVVESMSNGVDADYFSPDAGRASPFPAHEVPLVFTGAMDYWPNIDAATWFVRDMLPALRSRWPSLRFHVVGRNPTAAVRALASDAVNVTGTVPDVRPYLQHAAVVVAPLRLARGIQNKVLEAMAMARPVVTTTACADAVSATPGLDLLAADTAPDVIAEVSRLLSAPGLAQAMGAAGRVRVTQGYSWRAHLSAFEPYLTPAASGVPRLTEVPA